MKINIPPPESSQFYTSHNFKDYLMCHTKCWLRFHGEEGVENAYSNWAQRQNNAYRINGLKRLTDKHHRDEYTRSLSPAEKIKTDKWKLAVDFNTKKGNLQSRVHAVEHIPFNGVISQTSSFPFVIYLPTSLPKKISCERFSLPLCCRKPSEKKLITAKLSTDVLAYPIIFAD